MAEEQMEKPKAKRRTKIVLPIVIVGIIAAVIALFIKNMNGPAEGEISQVQPTASKVKFTQTDSGKYDGKYISFTYPANYKIVPSQKSVGFLDIVSLDNTDHSGKYISIGVLRETLANDSGISYRSGHPDLYKKMASKPDTIVFIGTGQSAEQTGFIAQNGLVTSVSVTAIGVKDLSKDYDAIANSLQWK
jgi:hypothetical protein